MNDASYGCDELSRTGWWQRRMAWKAEQGEAAVWTLVWRGFGQLETEGRENEGMNVLEQSVYVVSVTK